MAPRKSKSTWEFGDFQTPDELSMQIVALLQQLDVNPASVVEPTCGKGSLLINAIKTFPHAQKYFGADINENHLQSLKERVESEEIDVNFEILHANFFETDWKTILSNFPQPILIIGNPPWVTSSDLSLMRSKNLPEKSNFHNRNGIDALTGKSNFDISEWMLLQHLDWLQDKEGAIAVLCKTSVARKLLIHAWQKNIDIYSSNIYRIDAQRYFEASVDACLLFIQMRGTIGSQICNIYNGFDEKSPAMVLGYQDNILLAHINNYQNLRHLFGDDKNYIWRSGVKHDCSKIMELDHENGFYINGEGKTVELEDDFLYPLLKSSDIGNNRLHSRQKYMIVTQKYTGEDTSNIKNRAPKTWKYLHYYHDRFARRGSSIYRNRPDFSIFGVGDYTFAPWKVAISGFYKHLHFVVIPPFQGKPVVFDDTVYFLSCSSEEEAVFISELLNSDAARSFLNSMIFWEDKRPITIDILKRLSLQLLSRNLGKEDFYLAITKHRGKPIFTQQSTQLQMFEKETSYN